jgi:hypothetical protein
MRDLPDWEAHKVVAHLVPAKVEDIWVEDLEHFFVDFGQDFVHLLIDDVQLKQD